MVTGRLDRADGTPAARADARRSAAGVVPGRPAIAVPAGGQLRLMAAQMGHLVAVAAMPNVTVQVLPAVAHPATASELIVTESAAYAENVVGGYVFTEEETVSRLVRLFHTIDCESHRASESLRMIERLGEAWATGGNPLTRTPTEALA